MPMDVGGAQRAPPLAEKIWVIDGCLGEEVSCLQGYDPW